MLPVSDQLQPIVEDTHVRKYHEPFFLPFQDRTQPKIILVQRLRTLNTIQISIDGQASEMEMIGAAIKSTNKDFKSFYARSYAHPQMNVSEYYLKEETKLKVFMVY